MGQPTSSRPKCHGRPMMDLIRITRPGGVVRLVFICRKCKRKKEVALEAVPPDPPRPVLLAPLPAAHIRGDGVRVGSGSASGEVGKVMR